MARNNITLRDKALVKKRLAQGMSYRQAIKGTAIRSADTARRITKENSHEIVQLRKDYLALIESFDAFEIDRAEIWANMTRATKVFAGKKVPDWSARLQALKYIDELAGLAPREENNFRAEVNIDNRRLYVMLPAEEEK
jgi:hypothetical protein